MPRPGASVIEISDSRKITSPSTGFLHYDRMMPVPPGARRIAPLGWLLVAAAVALTGCGNSGAAPADGATASGAEANPRRSGQKIMTVDACIDHALAAPKADDARAIDALLDNPG